MIANLWYLSHKIHQDVHRHHKTNAGAITIIAPDQPSSEILSIQVLNQAEIEHQ